MDFNKYYNMEEYPQNLNGMDFSKDLFVDEYPYDLETFNKL